MPSRYNNSSKCDSICDCASRGLTTSQGKPACSIKLKNTLPILDNKTLIRFEQN